jgi:hypothetical protein
MNEGARRKEVVSSLQPFKEILDLRTVRRRCDTGQTLLLTHLSLKTCNVLIYFIHVLSVTCLPEEKYPLDPRNGKNRKSQ